MANPLDIKSIMVKALQRLSKQHNVLPEKVAVKMYLHPEKNILAFKLFIGGKAVELPDREEGLMSFNRDILGQGVDLLNREVILNQLIMPPAMQKFVTETRAESPFDIHVMIGTVNNETCAPYLYLYKGNEAVRQVYLEKDF